MTSSIVLIGSWFQAQVFKLRFSSPRFFKRQGSVRGDGRNRHPRSRCQPFVVGLERQTDLVVENPQIAVSAAHDRSRHDSLHLLRHHADIELVAAVVGEAIEAKAVVEPPQQGNVVLEPNIGASPATATPTATTAATTAGGGTGASPTSASACASAASAPAAIGSTGVGEALPATIGINARPVGRAGIAKGIARGPRAGGRPISAGGAIVCASQVSGLDIAGAGFCSGTAAEIGAVAARTGARLQDLLAASTAEIHARVRSAADIAIATEL